MKAANEENKNETENAQNNNNSNNNETTTTAPPPPTDANGAQEAAAEAASSNQETELAAMVEDDNLIMPPPAQPPPPPRTTTTTTNTAISTQLTATTTTATNDNETTALATLAKAVVASCFVVPSTPPHGQATASSGAISGSSSLKKKRNKSSTTKRSGSGSNSARSSMFNDGTHGAALEAATTINGAANSNGAASIKTSLSMTSLPPDDEKQESRDVLKAKLRVERPYNSLKKNSDRSAGAASIMPGSSPNNNNSGNKHHRYSWASSGHSHSSSSLHSSAATLGVGKDDLWAAIQTNYNYIMDTNLLDTCKEARYEIEGAASVLENPIESCFKMLDETQRSGEVSEDPKELRKWLRDMEAKLDTAPSLSEATLFNISELQRHLAEHSVLYHEIVSHARVVSACIRVASEREQQLQQQQQQLLQLQQQQQQQQQQQSLDGNTSSIAEQNHSSLSSIDDQATASATTTATTKSSNTSSSGFGTGEGNTPASPPTSSPLPPPAVIATTTSAQTTATATAAAAAHKKSEGSLERLQNRYHLLYLKAFEVQLWLDGLLRKKSSSTSVLNGEIDDDDDDASSSECDDDDDDEDDDDDDENDDGATEDDLNDVASDLESDATHNTSSSFCGDLLQQRQQRRGDSDAQSCTAQTRGDCIQTKADCEDGDDEDEEDEEDEVDCSRDWSKLGYSGVVLTCEQSVGGNTGRIGGKATATLTDFEADSESSDFELVQQQQNLRRQRKLNVGGYSNYAQQQQQKVAQVATNTAAVATTTTTTITVTNNTHSTPSEGSLSILHTNALATIAQHHAEVATNNVADLSMADNNISNYCQHNNEVLQSKMGVHVAGNGSEQLANVLHLSSNGSNNNNTATLPTAANTSCSSATQTTGGTKNLTTPVKQKSIAIISPNCHNNVAGGSNNKSPTVLRKRPQQQRDISKFNRSNRKSKNCAIFYFKHLDTDNETNYSGGGGDGEGDDDGAGADGGGSGGLSSSNSHTSDLLKSADASSDDDEGWLYSSAPAAASTSNIDGLNSTTTTNNKNNNNISTVVVDGIQSSMVSSSTNTKTTTTAASATVAAIISDDSDKENKEALAAAAAAASTAANLHLSSNNNYNNNNVNASSLNSTQIAIAEIQLASTVSRGGCSNSNSNSDGSSISGSCSSNDLLTEATTTTTSATTTTQITQMHCTAAQQKQQQQQQRQQQQHRSEMELQINGVVGSNKNKAQQQQHQQRIISNNCDANLHNNNIADNNNHNQRSVELKNVQQQQQQQQQLLLLDSTDANGNSPKDKMCFYTRADICNITVKPSPDLLDTARNPGKRLPPRSPAKAGISGGKSKHKANGTAATTTMSPTKGKVSHESIQQLVREAEHLVRDEAALKTPSKQQKKQQQQQKHSTLVKISSTVKKREVTMPGPTKQRVQEWLEHQPSTPTLLHKSHDLLLVSGSSSVITNSNNNNTRADDCEASGEASETDSITAAGGQPGGGGGGAGSDSSEGCSDSIATCMQTSTNSYGASTERIGGSAEPIVGAGSSNAHHNNSNQSLNIKIVKRQQSARRKSERPWSVSCISQLTADVEQEHAASVASVADVQAGLASHSISESALDSLSPRRVGAGSGGGVGVGPRASTASNSAATLPQQQQQHKSQIVGSSSLKRRKTRKKKLSNAAAYSAGKKSDSGSEELGEMPKLTQTLLMKSCESMSAQQIQEITSALLSLQRTTASSSMEHLTTSAAAHQSPPSPPRSQKLQQQQQQLLKAGAAAEPAAEEEPGTQLPKPNFRVGSYTTAYMTNKSRLGSLAALATYMNDDEQQGEYTTGTEDHHSSFSETAWDNYQEKYNSENYSEGFDSDAARRLMEFGDDYRNFIDSQSDCCSSLSAANNVDSLSPPRMDSLQLNETKLNISQDTIVSSVDHARRRRALELEYERRRKTLEVRRKSCQDSSDNQNPRSPTISLSSSANALTPKNADKFQFQQHKSTAESANRKLEFGMSHSAQSLRRTSESDTSTRRRKADERRRSSRNLEKCIKLIPATSSSSCDDSSDGEKEMRNLLQQSRIRLEDTRSLKIRCHLLRPEDYTEIINTCRDNIRCLESVLRGPPGSVLSSHCVSQTKDLLAAWEDLLGWSENAAAARKMQEEMIVLKHALNRLGNKSTFELLDTEPSIQIAIEALKNEKSQLQTYRTNMLRLNASVHSWLTRQERKLQTALVEQQLKEAASRATEIIAQQEAQATINENEAAESEQTQEKQITTTTTTTTTTATTFTVTDNNGNQVEAHSAASAASIAAAAAVTTMNTVGTSTASTAVLSLGAPDKAWDLNTLMNSENEFHKHLKDEVSDMYSSWDEADARINTQLDVLTTSLVAWRQLECGLSEFQLALGQDRGTLKGLEGALDKGQATPVEMAQNVKLVAKLLSEKVNVSQEQLTAVQEHLDPNHILHIAKFTASNGSLSDSGISDGGATSDGGLSERERRLGVLRRLAKQLESALAPGSEAMKSIAARMESAEAELKNLQNTCRDLIVRTAATHQNKKLQQLEAAQAQQKTAVPATANIKINNNNVGQAATNGHAGGKKATANSSATLQSSPPNSPAKRKNNKRRQRRNSSGSNSGAVSAAAAGAAGAATTLSQLKVAAGAPDGDPSDDPALEFELESSDDDAEVKRPKNGWAWRIAKAALPMQLALFTFLCAACLMQPNCCDNLNNLSMSFTPQLRYIRGPPPI